MPCYHPIDGYICRDGRFRQSPGPRDRDNPQRISCSKCVGCRLRRAKEWAIRVMHEASLYRENCFITLTYDKLRMPDRPDTQLPADVNLYYEDFQLFMKTLRERYVGSDEVTHPYVGTFDNKHGKMYPDTYRPIRFYMCGEYGEKKGRPHFHACIFNFDFPDKKYWRKTDQGHKVYRSAILEELWPHGNCEIGSLSWQSAAYVARYIMKKVVGEAADQHYQTHHPYTGEIMRRTPEFTKMSLKPGIAEGWFRKYWRDVFPHDFVIYKGRKTKPPRYYDKKFFAMTAQEIEIPQYLSNGIHIGDETVLESIEIDEIYFSRELEMRKFVDDNTPARLAVKEQCQIAQLEKLKRSLT